MTWRSLLKCVYAIVYLGMVPSAGASFSGQLKSSTDDYSYHLGPPTSDLVPYLSLEVSEKYKFNKRWRFQGRGLALTNLESKSAPEKFYADLPEAFLEGKFTELKIRAGLDSVNWGVVDVASPSDTVNTSALLHPLRSFKQGAPMVEAQMAGENLGFHLIYIPVQRRPLLPSTDSRWLPRRFLVNIVEQNTRVLLPPFMEYQYDAPETLDHALNNNYGAKLTAHQGRWDFQVTHFDGASPSPKARPNNVFIDATGTDAVVRSPIHLAPVTYRVRTTGAGAVWAREKWIWRAESAYQHSISKDDLLQPWSWANVLAVETNLELGSTTMTWLAQYYYTKNPQAADNLPSSSYRLFDRTAVLGTRWAVNDELTITLSVLYESLEQGIFAQAGFEQKLSDALKWGLAWHDFSAASDGLIKTYEKNDYATLDLSYYF